MKNMSKSLLHILAPLLIAFIVLFGPKSINAQEVENEREFDYGAKSGRGPRKWGEITEEWAACSNGTMQSPIDMSNERVKIISKPEMRHYKASNATIRNRGHDIQCLRFDLLAMLDQYTSKAQSTASGMYAHWHSPSEHTIHGRRYDMELHMVHQSIDPNVKNPIAVLGVFYRIGKPDYFLSKLMTNISSMIDARDEERNVGMVDPNDIQMLRRKYYRYLGSLTIPPCTEGVIWTLSRKVKTVSWDQVKLLREAVHDYAEENARPLQPKNNRVVDLYGPGVAH